jgi:hypothetical protein
MATSNGFTVNDNQYTKDTRILDLFLEPHIFLNELVKRKPELTKNSVEIEIDSRYDFRPDRLAFEYYGQDFWFPAILLANNLGSILQFKADTLGFKCRIPNADTIIDILGSPPPKHYVLKEVVDSVFK